MKQEEGQKIGEDNIMTLKSQIIFDSPLFLKKKKRKKKVDIDSKTKIYILLK